MMNPIVMVNGQPGKMATIIAEGIKVDSKYELSKNSLTGPDQVAEANGSILVPPSNHYMALKTAIDIHGENLYVIDFAKGKGVADENARMYIEHRIPFVMGATGVSNNYEDIKRMAEDRRVPCVAFPNMDLRLNAWMNGLAYMAEEYPRVFAGASVNLSETHQQDKPDTSGTMKAMLGGLGRLIGEKLTAEDILKIRDQKMQAKLLGVPNNWIGWHAYHFLKVYNEHDGVEDSEELTFKRHGGECYRIGTMKALDFLVEGKNTKNFNTMIDVIKAG